MVKGQLRKRIGYLALLTSLLMLRGLPAQERRPEDSTTPEKGTFALMEMYDQLGPFVVSVDGLGTRSESGTLTVEKPPEGSVRKAFLAAATTSFFRRFLMPGEVKLLGQDVVWQFAFPSDLSSFNHWAEVTDIVKPYLESQPAGRHELDVDEVDSEGIEGEILVVVFEVPPPANLSRIVLFFGSQDTSGARFGIEDLDLRGRFDPREERTLLDLGLGIASSFEPGEYTAVKVNDQPLTSRAGGADDGEAARGALLTVGGLGDDNANPLDLNDADDELYDLKPFLGPDDTRLSIWTRNIAGKDNLFFAYVLFSMPVNEFVNLSPDSAIHLLQTEHEITARVHDRQDRAVVGKAVRFLIAGGPHANTTATDTTGSEGLAHFVYTGSQTGTDTIVAAITSESGDTLRSAAVTATWVERLNCQVAIISPDNHEEVEADSIWVTAAAEARGGLPEITSTCRINEVPVERSSSAQIRARIPLAAGDNTIVASCTFFDHAGDSTSCADTIHVRRTQPAVRGLLLGVDEDRRTLVGVDISTDSPPAIPQLVEFGTILYNGKAIPEMEAMARDPDSGHVFIISNRKGGRLFKIMASFFQQPLANDIVPAELVGRTGSTDLDGIAIHPQTGTMFGVDNKKSILVTIDKQSATVTKIGRLPFSDIEAMAFSPGNEPKLYGVDNDSHQLLILDTSRGTATPVSPFQIGFKNVEALTFSGDGRLFGFSDSGREKFITIERQFGLGMEFPTSGAIGHDIEGMTFLPVKLDEGAFTLKHSISEAHRPKGERPDQFSVTPNYPNPFNPSTTFRLRIPGWVENAAHVSFKIYSLKGELVRVLLNGKKPPGEYTIHWNGTNQQGEPASSGVYFYRVTIGPSSQSGRMMLLK